MAELGRISGGLLKDNLLRTSNLNFKNTTSDTALLHLEVTNRRIGINTESPDTALQTNVAASTNYISDYANIDDISIQYILNGNEIRSNNGDLIFASADKIDISSLATDDINFNNKTISTYTPNTDLEFRPSGTGELNIRGNTNITGNLYATGDITFNASLQLGDSDTDNIEFAADVNSNIVPNSASTYNLGSITKKWQNLYSSLLNTQRVEVDAVVVDGTTLTRRQGNIFYVSTLGDDSNVGDHQHSAFRTLKHALSVVDASSEGPVTIHVYPGEYEEEFPLTIPERVTVSGEDIRNVIIKPTVATQNNDAFYLNQNIVIENLTVTDFYSPGHAFSFASGAVILERSPYIRNITVITQGTVTSSTDPRGFNTGDAGKGALIDGNVVDSSTPTPSMLFHSVTFITPGVDAITMTNGVRVEWLNSFTYFANRGLYALQGTGRTNPSAQLEYGAEIRSIGSASVYGNFGAVADGSDTLMYLIGHNFAYIGTGKNVSNDKTLTLFDQETQEINQGRIYYTSTDAEGTFRIGDVFFVDFTTGETSIDIDNIDFSGVSSIFINDGGTISYIDGERIDIGNIRFSGNTIFSLDGDIIWKSATDFVYLNNNPNFRIAKGPTTQRKSEESDLRYNTSFDLFEGYGSSNIGLGGVYSDDYQTNITAINPQGDIVFTANSIETARISGNAVNLDDSSQGQFGNIELNGLFNGDISFQNNLITTTLSNSNLELVPNGSSNTQIQDLFVYSNVIENFENSNFSLFVTDRGYVKFDTTVGVVIPFGSTNDRPGTPEIGDTRWNQELSSLETYNGTDWQRSAGTGEEVTEDILKDLVDIYSLVLG